ncbi:MAG: NAD(P)-binding domain-containing protein [Tissierellia bacterium]|nr:NAD(P)-binding domain-containing protein [Tissierellia bacterium]
MGMRIGFIGTGVIASALVNGFCSAGDLDHNIIVSPRNAQRAKELADKYENVTVASSNQEVVDKSEWVVLSVVPQLGEEIIRPLKFREDHRVVNLMSDRKLEEIASWIGKTRTLAHVVPLPFAARRIGPIVVYPQDKDVIDLFSPIGEVVAVDSIEKVRALQAITAMMSPYYKLLWEVVKWGQRNGLSEKESMDYTLAFFQALSYEAEHNEKGDLEALAEEMTPGGINEMAYKNIINKNGYEPWIESLDQVFVRLMNRQY